ncbi:MAG TPA: type II toxin-antitoxin system RelE/ParE family toxin [Cryomorphaceae bacterium]|nr:type II toxin-antitoxin system RelE/ParE family toxin [Cryomorphaceae bacterium]
MPSFRLSNEASEDLIRIHHYGMQRFGEDQADKYLSDLFKCFGEIAERPFSFSSVEYIKAGYRRAVCGSDSIYFTVNNNIVEVMAVVGRQDLENLL